MSRRLENIFSWSVSRARLFEECQRAYYYQYYGSWGGWEADAAPEIRQLYILKNIASMPMWAGSIVHETIADALKRFARDGHHIAAGELQARARQKLRAGWIEAVNRRWLQAPKRTNLHELYYGNGKTLPAEQTERIKARVYNALEHFATSEILQQILAAPYVDWKPVDQLDSFSLQGLKVWCAVDFAYIDPARQLRIIDWKTGADTGETIRTQLACYALYAAEKWFTPIEDVRLYAVFLGDNDHVREYACSAEDLVEAQDRVLTSAAEMRSKLSDVARNAAEEQNFPCCENERTCRRCNYREVCPGAPPAP